MNEDAEYFETESWQDGFWTGYRLGIVRGRLIAWRIYAQRLLARTADRAVGRKDGAK